MEIPGAVWRSSSTKVSHPYWELLEGQCPLERSNLATKLTMFRTGQESLTGENQGKTQDNSLQMTKVSL